MPRTRDTAGAQEIADIAAIVEGIRTRTGCGPKIMAAFSEQFGVEILDARPRPRQRGNRGTHYDFEILVGPAPGVWRRVEHKGSAGCVPVSPMDKPWTAGVQFHNGGCEKYTIARKFARAWYDFHVGSGSLKAAWGITAEIPTFEEWYAKDAKQQDNPRTAFGIELKARVRAAGRSSLLEERAPVVAAFEITAEDLRLLGEEAIAILNEALDQKDYWLTIHGDPMGEFHCRWWPPFRLVAPSSITVRKELDIWFDFACEGGISFSGLLRWGKGAGFSNLRIDAR